MSVSSLGYAVPGTVLAIGVISPFATFDNTLAAFMRSHFDISTGLLLSGTMLALIFAYTVLTAALVVFVDCMKELPATLVLRPFNFDTLATHVYQFASVAIAIYCKSPKSQ